MKYQPFKKDRPYKVSGELGSKIKPPRYVYHLDKTGGRFALNDDKVNCKRVNIAKEGLYGPEKGHAGVWVNVYQGNPYRWFPITLDLWDCKDLKESRNLIGCYDVWRIDTTMIDNKWYIDPNMFDFEVFDLSKVLFTPAGVPGRALKLFHMHFNYEIMYKHQDFRIGELKPFKLINDYIKYVNSRRRIYKISGDELVSE